MDGHAERMFGALLGAWAGDALGAPVEGDNSESVDASCRSFSLDGPTEMMDRRELPELKMTAEAIGLDLLATEPDLRGKYTDDTEMMLALASSLIRCLGLCPEHCALATARAWAEPPFRGGYSAWTHEKLAALSHGTPFTATGAMHDAHPAARSADKGSFGNGSCMRIAPIGLFYHHLSQEPSRMREVVSQAIVSTHTHPEAVEAASVMALAVARLFLLSATDRVSPHDFLVSLTDAVHEEQEELRSRMRAIATALAPEGEGWLCKCDTDRCRRFFCADDKRILQSCCTPDRWFQSRAIDAVAYTLYMVAKYGELHRPRRLGEDREVDRGVDRGVDRDVSAPFQAVVRTVALGGDCDTLACMVGACMGSLHGSYWVPESWRRWMRRGEQSGPKDPIEELRSMAWGLARASEAARGLSEQMDIIPGDAMKADITALRALLSSIELPPRHEL